jgi:hypothetical protein
VLPRTFFVSPTSEVFRDTETFNFTIVQIVIVGLIVFIIVISIIMKIKLKTTRP